MAATPAAAAARMRPWGALAVAAPSIVDEQSTPVMYNGSYVFIWSWVA